MALLDRFVDTRPATADDARRRAKNAQTAALVAAVAAVALFVLALVPPAQAPLKDWTVPLLAVVVVWLALHDRALDQRQTYWDLRDREAGPRRGR